MKPDVLRPDVLKPDVLKPDVLWVYRPNRFKTTGCMEHWVQEGGGGGEGEEGGGGARQAARPDQAGPSHPGGYKEMSSIFADQ